jgi:hypothetical protein
VLQERLPDPGVGRAYAPPPLPPPVARQLILVTRNSIWAELQLPSEQVSTLTMAEKYWPLKGV